MKKLLVIQVAALGHELLRASGGVRWRQLEFAPAQGVFPAVTCTVQGSFRTAAPPAVHGMVANGLYHRALHRPMFWEQSCDLVSGERIWAGFRRRGGRVGMMFWQQSLGEDVDLLLSPAPIHRHHGGMIHDCYSLPRPLYAALCDAVGGAFKLSRYWGPLASAKVGDWIASAASAVLADAKLAPELLLVYLPSLDYDLQRRGPAHPKSAAALQRTLGQMHRMVDAAALAGYETLIFGDYTIGPCSQAALPNLALAQAGLLATRPVRGMLYCDFHASRAFAMVDHEVAHVYVRNASDVPSAAEVLAQVPGVGAVLTRAQQAALGLDHPNSGELLVVAQDGWWLAYPWWRQRQQAPDYATHIDIHNKPGYDPCELFFGWPPPSVSLDTSRIAGSHGRVGPGREIAWAATFDLARPIGSILDLAAATRDWLG